MICAMCDREFEPFCEDHVFGNVGAPCECLVLDDRAFCSSKCMNRWESRLPGICYDESKMVRKIPSPCNEECRMKFGVCQSCGMDNWEISTWDDASDWTRIAIRAKSSRRLASIV